MTSFKNGIPAIELDDRERAALAELAGFPLYSALFGRRSRRFPAGGEIPDGVLAFKSRQPARPLTSLQRALVLATTAGQTGWHHAITRHPGYAPQLPNYSGSAIGRTFPSAAGFHTTQFFFTDDSGTYYLPTRDGAFTNRLNAQTFDSGDAVQDALNELLTRVVRIGDQRLFLPREQPYFEGHNTWIGNHPGSLLVIPVADLAQQTLLNIAFFAQNGYVVYDDINGREIPGLERFADTLAHWGDPQPLSFVEQYSLAEASAELMTSTYAGHLALGAIGLGGWSFDGLDRLSVLGASGDPRVPGLGFRYDEDDRWSIPNPTGREGLFESLTRPHFGSMRGAVEALVERKFGPGGPFHPATPGPWKDSTGVRAAAAPFDDRLVDLITVQAEYIDSAFGKFPGTVPSVWIQNYLQAQHLDTEFYDTHFIPGAYLPTHANERERWGS
ncbi:hypothetical protein [Gulosibacter sp. 10]|uniref:hypothetical protein n=1 Tax=Gulosibacter sp. 10 TaxID=1255570 RepID=UPI00097F269A|nr:hypothetical protein [Gulosibacter sp. 10]SJM63985.1 hypothetical protein FM112_09685 [Gulosibacter sp. 10]